MDNRWWILACGATIHAMPRRNADLARVITALERDVEAVGHVCTYQQARAAGVPADAIRRLVDSGRWVRVHRGVFHLRSSPPDLLARMWAAHLALGPTSVVAGAAAAHYWGLLEGGLPADQPMHMLLAESVRRQAPGVQVRRVPHPHERAHPSRRPSVLSVEHTVIDLVGTCATDAAAVEIVLRAARMRLTTPQRIRAALATMHRVRRRALITSLCAEVEAGRTSPLEIRYHRDVARPHGLPPAAGQVRASTGSAVAYRDVLYAKFATIVELDGRVGHESEFDAFRDQSRDNAATLTGAATLRFGWLAVTRDPCAVAMDVGRLLQLRGWTGAPRPCSPSCPAARAPRSRRAAA